MVRGKGIQHKEVLSANEKAGLLDSKRDLENQLKEAEEFGAGTAASQIDKSTIKKQIDRIDREIELREPPKISGTRKDELAKEARAIEEQVIQGMPTREEMNHPAKHPGAVRKHLGWLKRNNHLIERYRRIQRLINPEEPDMIENLRKDK